MRFYLQLQKVVQYKLPDIDDFVFSVKRTVYSVVRGIRSGCLFS